MIWLKDEWHMLQGHSENTESNERGKFGQNIKKDLLIMRKIEIKKVTDDHAERKENVRYEKILICFLIT